MGGESQELNEGQEPEDGQVNTPGTTATNSQPMDMGNEQGQEPRTFDEEYVKKLRAEAAGYRRRVRELEEKVKRYEDEKLSEQERLQKRLVELEQEHAQVLAEMEALRLRHAVERAASKLGFRNPEDAYQLADLSGVAINEDGTVEGIEAALKALAKERPYLLRQEGSGGDIDATRGGRGKQEPDLEALRRRFGI